jgi:uncharacterized protein (DUF885 family)
MTDHDLRAIAEQFWEESLDASPTFATFVGDHRHDDRIEDLSVEAEARHAERAADLRAKLDAIDVSGLDEADRVTHGLLVGETTNTIEAVAHRFTELRSDQMEGVHVDLLQTTGVLGVHEPDHAWRIVERFRQIPGLLITALQRFTAGAEAGRTPARICIERSLNVLDGYLATAVDDDVFVNFTGPTDWDGEASWRTELRSVATADIRPAFAAYRDALADELLPVARDDEHAGLCWLDDGEALSQALTRHHTSHELSPEEIHAIGLAEVTERLPGEYADLGGRLFGSTDLATTFERLRTDPSLRYANGDEIMADARTALAAATAAMPAWFGRLPQSPCAIEEVPAYLAADSPAAYYFPPAGDGSRPGTYFVNTHEPTQKNRYEAASVGYHEAIPGHHLQIAIANELDDVPQFQRFSLSNTAYVEGWGLYAERLADEMGLYTTDLDRIGMLAADSWRACRLVVDTGLHALGWSRQRAIDFMATHTPVSLEEVTVEIDRYIGMPGQALAYKLGQREIFRLREAAASALGERFDIRAFHDVVLGSGAVSLPVLSELVAAWVLRSGGDPTW